MRKHWMILLALCLLFAFAGTATAEGSVTLTDMAGRTVSLRKPAERIVALTASDCEILFALGAGDLLVGRGEYCDYPAEVLSVPSVQSGYETNLEEILALRPDVVVKSVMAQTIDETNMLEAAGIRVVNSDAQTIDDVYVSIDILGQLTGKQTEAEALISSMKQTFEEVSANAETLAGKTIYFEVSPLEWGLWTAGQGTFMNEVAELIGLANCFADVIGWARISEEDVIARNPDYILTIAVDYGYGPSPIDEILSRPAWQGIAAVRNGAILNLQNDELSRPSPRLAEGAKLLYDFVNAAE